MCLGLPDAYILQLHSSKTIEKAKKSGVCSMNYAHSSYIINNLDLVERFRLNLPRVKSIEENAKELEEIYNNLVNKNQLCKLSY